MHVQRRLTDTVYRALCAAIQPDASESARHVHDDFAFAFLEERKVELRDECGARYVRDHRALKASPVEFERSVLSLVLRIVMNTPNAA